jgi:hypothetical protein
MLNKLKRFLGIPSPSQELIAQIDVTPIEIDPEAVREAVERKRKRLIWEGKNLPLGV